VSARDKASGKENKITIKANSGLNEAEIQRMVKDAEANAAEDHKRRELVESRNQADSLVHSVRKSLTEHGEKLSDAEKEPIEAALKSAEEALKSDDKERIDAAAAELMTASQKIGEKAYAGEQGAAAAAAAAGGAAGAGAAGAHDADVVDAEFKEVKRDA
jgi:molecular chaperone DnaK